MHLLCYACACVCECVCVWFGAYVHFYRMLDYVRCAHFTKQMNTNGKYVYNMVFSPTRFHSTLWFFHIFRCLHRGLMVISFYFPFLSLFASVQQHNKHRHISNIRYVLFSVYIPCVLLMNCWAHGIWRQKMSTSSRLHIAIFFIQNGSCCSLFVIKIITIDCMKRVQYIAEARIKFNMCQQHCIDLQSLKCNIVRT